MTDIVERLRAGGLGNSYRSQGFPSPVELEAADEIERLREALPLAVDEALQRRIFDFICNDVLPSYDIASEVGRNDPELADAIRAVFGREGGLMADIVERLRDVEHGSSWRLQLEAADEIERLRKVCGNTNAVTAATLNERDAEIERLRAELEAVKETNQKQYDIVLRQEQID